MRNLLAGITLLACLATPGPAPALDYFPSDPGPVFHYTGNNMRISPLGPGEFAHVWCGDCSFGGSSLAYRIDQSGDVYQTGVYYFSQAAPDGDAILFEPNLLYLDFPLDTWKSWVSTTVQRNLDGVAEDTITLSGYVAGPTTITVPAGTFDVIAVAMEYTYRFQVASNRRVILYFHRQLGPVNGLVSWEGIVATDHTSWGSLKALFR